MTTQAQRAGSIQQYSNRRVIGNASTGEQLEFTVTAAETHGAYAEVIITVPPGFMAIPTHAHPQQSEEFTVLAGKLGISNNGETRILEPGDSIVSPANSVHTWWNADDEELRFHTKIVPALHIAEILGTIYDSANARKSTEPSLMDAAYVLAKYRDEYDPVFLPKPVKVIGIPLLYAIGKVTGRHRLLAQWIAGHYA